MDNIEKKLYNLYSEKDMNISFSKEESIDFLKPWYSLSKLYLKKIASKISSNLGNNRYVITYYIIN